MISKRRIVLTIVISILTYQRIFPALDHAPVQTWDESTNVSVVKNSLSTHSFPALSRLDQPFFEKPPLWYFSTMLLAKNNAPTVANGRFISAVFGFLTILLTTFISWRWWGSVGAITTWGVLMTTNHLFITNPGGSFSTHTFRSADVDSMHILFLMVSFAAATHMHTRTIAVICGVAAGLSMLSKSPLGLLPLLVITMIQFNRPEKKYIVLAWISAAVILLPWYLWMSILYGLSFIGSHFGYHLWIRVTLPLDGHNKPLWYYINVLMGRHFFLSWEWLAWSTIYLYVQKKVQDKRIPYMLTMALVTLLIPTLTSTKLAWYLLPFYPFAALIIGAATSKTIQTLLSRHWSRGRTSNS